MVSTVVKAACGTRLDRGSIPLGSTLSTKERITIMATELGILVAKSRYERHNREHKCQAGACPKRVKLWQDYMKVADYRVMAQVKRSQHR